MESKAVFFFVAHFGIISCHFLLAKKTVLTLRVVRLETLGLIGLISLSLSLSIYIYIYISNHFHKFTTLRIMGSQN